MINNSKVGYEERIDAERAFIRHYSEKSIKPLRLIELEKKYGKLDKLVDINLKPKENVSPFLINNTVLHKLNFLVLFRLL